jgi:signal peptidase I
MSWSMEPFIHTGEEILIKKFNPETLKSFTPIVYWRDNKLICHFYVKKLALSNKTYYLTKGLGAKNFDKPVKEEFILGEVVSPKVSFLKKLIMRIAFRKTKQSFDLSTGTQE